MQNGPNNNCFKQICCEKWPKNRISDVNFSDLQWRSNDLRSQFCQLLPLEILKMNHHKKFQVPKWSPSAISRTYKITRFFTTIWIVPPPPLYARGVEVYLAMGRGGSARFWSFLPPPPKVIISKTEEDFQMFKKKLAKNADIFTSDAV